MAADINRCANFRPKLTLTNVLFYRRCHVKLSAKAVTALLQRELYPRRFNHLSEASFIMQLYGTGLMAVRRPNEL
jgi:hypothetical protein